MPLKEFKAKLIPELKELNVATKKNLLSEALAGELTSNLKGRGIEFEDYRDYSVTDDAQRIDWRASKRAQRLLVREYKLEINLSVFFLIDTSESMLFGSTSKLKCEYSAEVLASLYYGILQTGNAVGFGLFSEKMYRMTKPLLGKKQFYIFAREISNHKNYGGVKNMVKALQQLLSVLDRKSLIFILSDYLLPISPWAEVFKIIAAKHEVIGILIQDPLDISIPSTAGQLLIQDPFSGETLYIDAKQYHKIYKEYNEKHIKELRLLFEQNNATIMELVTNQPTMSTILQYFRKKGGRWR